MACVPADARGESGDPLLRNLFEGVQMTEEIMLKVFSQHGITQVGGHIVQAFPFSLRSLRLYASTGATRMHSFSPISSYTRRTSSMSRAVRRAARSPS